jgi:hypothetical protein
MSDGSGFKKASNPINRGRRRQSAGRACSARGALESPAAGRAARAARPPAPHIDFIGLAALIGGSSLNALV